MNRNRLLIVIPVALALGLLAWWMWPRVPPSVYPENRRVSYGFVVSNLGNRSVKDARLWLIAPLDSTATQRVVGIHLDSPHSLITDAAGNPHLQLELDSVPPYGQREIRVEVELALAAEPNPSIKPDADWLTKPQRGIESDDASIAELASTLRGANASASIASIEGWLRSNIKSTAYDAQDRGAHHALETRSGDCTEFAYLATALARAMGLPARAVDGWMSESDGWLEASGFHTWAEVWDGERWRVLDAQREAPLQEGTRYIGMRIAPADEQSFSASFTRFRIEGEGLAVRMH